MMTEIDEGDDGAKEKSLEGPLAARQTCTVAIGAPPPPEQSSHDNMSSTGGGGRFLPLPHFLPY